MLVFMLFGWVLAIWDVLELFFKMRVVLELLLVNFNVELSRMAKLTLLICSHMIFIGDFIGI